MFSKIVQRKYIYIKVATRCPLSAIFQNGKPILVADACSDKFLFAQQLKNPTVDYTAAILNKF